MPRVQVDFAPIEQTQAASLVIHHLAMAAGIFQGLPEGDEREQLKTCVEETFQGWNIERKAVEAFVEAICSAYDELRFQDEAEEDAQED